MMKRGENSDSIPTDLFLEIFSRLPIKSIGRFRCVSKLWGSMLNRPYFSDLFLTRSSARPRLLFAIIQYGVWSFYSLPQPQNPYGKSSLVVSANFHMKLYGGFSRYNFSYADYAAGLIYLHNIRIPKEDKVAEHVICNIITGQYAILPELRADIKSKNFLGFDPIDKEFKLLSAIYYMAHDEAFHCILTLGNGKMRWRNIQCPLIHYPIEKGICINGVLYYFAQQLSDYSRYVIVCFDVRSEKFKFIDAEWFPNPYGIQLINYKGKLGTIDRIFVDKACKLRMWVLEDVEKQEWSNYVYTLPKHEQIVGNYCHLYIVGVTATGEIVLSKRNSSKHLYVFYFNPERNTLPSVEIQGIEDAHEWFINDFYGIVDHVEDLNFNIMRTTYAATSISQPEKRRKPTGAFESANKFDILCLLDDDDDDEATSVKT